MNLIPDMMAMKQESRRVVISPPASHHSSVDAGVPRIAVRDVSKSFSGHQVLRNVTLEVYPQQVMVLLGPSGAGKSTLCRIINRLELVDRGDVLIDGVPLPDGGRPLAAMRSQVGMVFQSFNLFSHLTVLQNVMAGPLRVLGWSKQDAREKAFELLERVHISELAHQYPAKLSGGQQQRAAIARSLAMNPKIMLFDEPTSALDPEMISEVVDVMADLAAEGMTMIIVSHEIGFARRCADRCVFMADGRIIEEAPPAEFFSNPQTERAQAFLSRILP